MATGTSTVLLTRPRAASERFAASLARGIPVLIAPLVEIEPVGEVVDPGGFAAIVLTSANAIPRLKHGAGGIAYCVGDRTAEVAREAGFETLSASGDVDALAALVKASPPHGRIMYPRGSDSRGDLAERLRAAGFDVVEVVVYRQADQTPGPNLQALVAGSGRVVAPVFSPLGASRLAAAAPARDDLTGVAISAPAAAPLLAAGWTVTIAAEPTADAMRRAVESAISGA